MQGIVEYFIILMAIYCAAFFAPQLLSLMNTVAGVGQESSNEATNGMVNKGMKGAIVLFAVMCAGFPVTLLFSGQSGRQAFFRPRAAYAAYQAKMARYNAAQNRSVVNISLDGLKAPAA